MRNIMFWLKQENAHLPRFCGIFKLLARPLPKSLEEEKIPVKTDIIDNNISLTVICGKSDCKMGHPRLCT